MRAHIYQLLVRTFGNTSSGGIFDGDRSTNGCGRFDQINDRALASLAHLGATHIWLTGVLRQASLTDYSHIDPRLAADDPDVVKGRAGSPFAVKDLFDVSPDLATDPAKRMQEFSALVDRIHRAGLKVLIDLIPNHVARSYASAVRPDLDFGRDDDRRQFFSPTNDFFYLTEPRGEPLQLTYPVGAPPRVGLDGRFFPEDGSSPGRTPRATGNNQTAHRLSAEDWYDVVKLNYGFNFVSRTGHYSPTPPVWTKVDAAIGYWQGLGVDGFRCDFAHWIPLEFWRWAIGRARARGAVELFAEVYDNPDAVPGYSKAAMIDAGFDGLYDSATYDAVKGVFAAGKWCNDLDERLAQMEALDLHLLRYAENHDERRAASPVVPGDGHQSGFGSGRAGLAATTLLHSLGRGPVLLHAGQEVGEQGGERTGFGGGDGRTSLFDYCAIPELAKWVNVHRYDGGGLSIEQRSLRQSYGTLWSLLGEAAFREGRFISLQPFNRDTVEWGGRGQWVYGFLRFHPELGQVVVILVNLNREQTYHPRVRIPLDLQEHVGPHLFEGALSLDDRLAVAHWSTSAEELSNPGVAIDLAPQRARILEVRTRA